MFLQSSESPPATPTLSVISPQSLCPAAIPTAASKVCVTPEGWPANELLLKAEALTQRGFNNASVTEAAAEEEQTNHHTRGLLQTEGARLHHRAKNHLQGAEINATRSSKDPCLTCFCRAETAYLNVF